MADARYQHNLTPSYCKVSDVPALELRPEVSGQIQHVLLYPESDMICATIQNSPRILLLSIAASHGSWTGRPIKLRDFDEPHILDFAKIYGYDLDELRELVSLAKQHDRPKQ